MALTWIELYIQGGQYTKYLHNKLQTPRPGITPVGPEQMVAMSRKRTRDRQ